MHPFPVKVRFALLAAALSALAAPAGAQWAFTDVTTAAGVNVSHSIDVLSSVIRENAAGVAAADYNRDGWMDLYFLGGNSGHNYLFHNNGDGTFSDVAVAAGVDLTGTLSSGPCFADWDGDGDSDLFVGGLEGASASFFRNNGDGTFTDVTVGTGVSLATDCFSSTFGDYDNDGDLDLFVAHWGVTPQGTGHIWRNNGDGTFTDADALVGYTGFPPAGGDNTFTYNLADINGDGWMDLLASSDFLTSHVYMNDGDGTFTNATNTGVIDDENGMGGSVADYDNDGDLDWFVTSIYSFPFKTGNRLYENDGAGNFSDATATAGVANGLWAWGATFQDFNNDGWLDIYHVNGWRNGYTGNRSRLFVSNQDKTFTGMAAAVNVDHPGQGRGVCALDYDNDGDLDLFLANNDEPCRLFRNDNLTDNWLQVDLMGHSPNTEEVGARVLVTIGASTQMREIRCGSNYQSQDPTLPHFGLGTASTANEVRVEWTNGEVTTLTNVAANQRLTVFKPAVDAPVVGPKAVGELTLLGAAPNPFRSGASIRFALARSTDASVRVFNSAGRVVRTLIDGARPAGEQAVAWDGRDSSGRAVASGIYYYEVRTPDQSERGKLVRIR